MGESVELLFKVAGGGSVAGESGSGILRDINSIVSSIEASGGTKLKFAVDTSSITTGLNNINKQVTASNSATERSLAKTTQTAMARINSSFGSMKGTVSQLNQANKATVDLNKAFNLLTIAKGKFDANPTSKNADAYRAQEIAVKDLSKAIDSQIVAEQKLEQARNNVEWNNLKHKLSEEEKEIVKNNEEWHKLEAEYQRLEQARNNVDWNNLKYKLDEENKALKESEQEYKKYVNDRLQYNKILSQARDYYDKYATNIQKNTGLNQEWIALKSNLKFDKDFASTQHARDQLEMLMRKTHEVGADVETLGQKLKRLFDAHLSTALAMVGVHLLQQSLRQVYQNVKELDGALVDLQIATGYTREETSRLISTYTELGKEIGATTTEVAKSADGWLRQGYSVEQTNTLIRNSMMLSKLGQIDSGEATKALTSTMKGYNIAVEDSVGIVDKFVAVDMKAAVSAGQIATAFSKTATSARLAGVDMNRLSGYISTVAEVTQGSAEEVGVFFKTLFSRMGNIKSGELIDPESSEDLSNVENVLKGVGITLRESGGEFRNFGDVLDEVNSKWDTYGTVQQRAIAVAFSGIRQQERFLTLMEHYDEALGYAGIASTSAGTAEDKFSNSYLRGVEASIDKIKASFEALSQTILKSEWLTNGIKAGSGILDLLSSIISLGDGAIIKIGLLATATKLLNKINLGRYLPSMPKYYSTVGFDKLVNCWEVYVRYYNYKVA